MPTTVSIAEAQATLPEIIARLRAGEEVIITEREKPVAKLVGEPAARRPPRTPGNCRGLIALQVEDDEHLEGFREYMP